MPAASKNVRFPGIVPTQCQLVKLTIRLVVASMSLSIYNADLETSKRPNGTQLMYLAYYYPWYISDDWTQHELPAGDIPLLGHYGTDSPVVAEQHVEWAMEARISSWVVSWWGTDGTAHKHFQQGMLPVLDARHEETEGEVPAMKFCLNYESKLLSRDPNLSFEDGTAQSKLLSDFKAIKKDYFDHPSYLRVGKEQRPIVVLYITRWITDNFGPEFNREVLDLIRSEVQEDVYFIADEPFFEPQHATPEASWNGLIKPSPSSDDYTNKLKMRTESVFDAYTTYNMYVGERVVPGETATEYMMREAMPIFQAWANHPQIRFFPNVLPMYHDFRDGHLPLQGNATDFANQMESAICLFAENDSQKTPFESVNNTTDTIVPDMIFVTSWNEWWEGSQIEPDKKGRYGFEFIQTLQDFKQLITECGYEWCSSGLRRQCTLEKSGETRSHQYDETKNILQTTEASSCARFHLHVNAGICVFLIVLSLFTLSSAS